MRVNSGSWTEVSWKSTSSYWVAFSKNLPPSRIIQITWETFSSTWLTCLTNWDHTRPAKRSLRFFGIKSKNATKKQLFLIGERFFCNPLCSIPWTLFWIFESLQNREGGERFFESPLCGVWKGWSHNFLQYPDIRTNHRKCRSKKYWAIQTIQSRTSSNWAAESMGKAGGRYCGRTQNHNDTLKAKLNLDAKQPKPPDLMLNTGGWLQEILRCFWFTFQKEGPIPSFFLLCLPFYSCRSRTSALKIQRDRRWLYHCFRDAFSFRTRCLLQFCLGWCFLEPNLLLSPSQGFSKTFSCFAFRSTSACKLRSSFFWLLSLLVSSLLWFIVGNFQQSYWILVPLGVFVVEMARFGFIHLYAKAERSFSVVSTNSIAFPLTDFYSSIGLKNVAVFFLKWIFTPLLLHFNPSCWSWFWDDTHHYVFRWTISSIFVCTFFGEHFLPFSFLQSRSFRTQLAQAHSSQRLATAFLCLFSLLGVPLFGIFSTFFSW